MAGERRIKNLDDSVYGSDATANPDIVIAYGYTDGTETGTPPKGLLESVQVTSQAGQPSTTYEYNIHGELLKVTYPDPDGTGSPLLAPMLQYAWNTTGLLAGTLASVTETDGTNYTYVTNSITR